MVDELPKKVATLQCAALILLKTDSITEILAYAFSMVTLHKLSGDFLRDNFAKHFLPKSEASNLQVATLLKKNVKLAFNSEGYLYCVKTFAEMPMPRIPNCQNNLFSSPKKHDTKILFVFYNLPNLYLSCLSYKCF